MAKKQGNMFGSFGQAVEDREQEQAKIEATVTTATQAVPQNRKRGAGATTMTLAISQEDKVLVKTLAAKQGLAVSDLFHLWIQREAAAQNV